MIGAIIEARMGSTRLPEKVLAELMPGWTMLDVIVARARLSARLETVAVATSTSPRDDAIARHCQVRGIPVFRGSEHDVLGRVCGAIRTFGLDTYVRLTGDNPLIDGRIIDDMIDLLKAEQLDYVATTMMGHSENWKAERTFPRGISMEVVRVKVILAVEPQVIDPLEREAATFHIYDHPDDYALGAFEAVGPYADCRHPELRLTVDTPEDMDLARRVFSDLGGNGPDGFDTQEAICHVAARPDLTAINAGVRPRVVSEMKAARQ